MEREVQVEHVHLVAELPLTISPINAIMQMKGISARIIFGLKPKLRLRYPKGHLWSSGKFAISARYITLEKAKEYVRGQEVHHVKFLNRKLHPLGCERRLPFYRALSTYLFKYYLSFLKVL